jgi:branched-subunit amino acid ABC-type transport system permease component
MSLGTLVLGLINGLIIGLLAVGFVLVYKANRFLNLAHAQLGAVAALLLAKVVNDWHWGFWPSFIPGRASRRHSFRPTPRSPCWRSRLSGESAR